MSSYSVDKVKLLDWLEKEEHDARERAKGKGVTFYDRAYSRGRFMAFAQLRIQVFRGDFDAEK